MQLATFNAVCDVEIGDTVKLIYHSAVTKIVDIRAVHYLRNKRVEFEFQLENSPGLWRKRREFVYPVGGENK